MLSKFIFDIAFYRQLYNESWLHATFIYVMEAIFTWDPYN